MISRPATVRERLRVIARGKDAIFDWADPLPFLLVHHVQIPWLLIRNLMAGRDWIRIDFCSFARKSVIPTMASAGIPLPEPFETSVDAVDVA